jgi:(R,R)-butanediol dehydrogenase/meso-butanediol dehydrogenase/diacetyl reductase
MVINTTMSESSRTLRDATGGEGVEVAFDAAGSAQAFGFAFRAIRRGGTLVNVALRDSPLPVDLNRLLAHELRVVGSTGYAGNHAAVIDTLARGGFGDATALVTRRIKLSDVVEHGFDVLRASAADHVKILVHPDEK